MCQVYNPDFQLAELTNKIGSVPEALAVYRKALALRRELAAMEGADVETRLDVARSLNLVGERLSATGDHAGALAALEEQRDLAERLEAEYPTDAVRSVLAHSYHGIGGVLHNTAKLDQALIWYRKGLAVRQKLADANPAVTRFQSDLAWSHNNIGVVLYHMGKMEESLTESRKALAIRQKLADANPTDTQFQSDLFPSYNNIGAALNRMGKPEEALTEHRKAFAIRQKIAAANPAVTELQSGLARSHNHIGKALLDTGEPQEALTEHRKALAIYQKLADANPAVPDYQSELNRTRRNLAWALAVSGRASEALPLLATAVAADPKDTSYSLQLAALQAWFGQDKELGATLERMCAVARDSEDAETLEQAARACCILPTSSGRELEEVVTLARRGMELDKGSTEREWRLLAVGMAEYRSGNYAAALEALIAAAQTGPNNAPAMGIAAFYQAMSLFRQGKEDEARELALAAVAKMKPLPKDDQNPLADRANHDDLILWLTCKEAKAMIGFDAAPTVPTSK